jgi:hypothetical protein
MVNKKTEKLIYQNIQFRKGEEGLLSLEQLAMITGTKSKLLKILVEKELLETHTTAHKEIKIHIDALEDLKRMLRLHYDLGVGWTSMPVVIDLLDRIDELESKLQKLTK